MTQTKLNLTIFEIEKLRNIVGFGRASPYQITTYAGDSVGMIGTIVDPETAEAANGEYSVAEPAAPARWFRRVLSASGLKKA
jgi:hypothetical protein